MALPPEVDKFLALDLPDEDYQLSLQALVEKMKAGAPAVMDLVTSSPFVAPP